MSERTYKFCPDCDLHADDGCFTCPNRQAETFPCAMCQQERIEGVDSYIELNGVRVCTATETCAEYVEQFTQAVLDQLADKPRPRSIETCGDCGGTGQIRTAAFSRARCPGCKGYGEVAVW